ncbi:MAG: ABC transporter permease [bacterium]
MNTFFILIKLAWRNIFRNKRRTLITAIAVGMGLASLIFVDALMKGMEKNMILSGTASLIGEGQIHANDFRSTQDVNLTINNLSQITESLNQEPIIEHFTLRTISFGMITSPSDVSSINLLGVNPETEQHLSEFDDTIIKGSYFKDINKRNIVIGSKLAELLEVDIGDRVVVTVAQSVSGELSQELFKVSGIYNFNIKELDTALALINLDQAQKMLTISDNVHEIALKFNDANVAQDETLPFWEKYSQNGNEAVGWTKLLPELKAALDLSGLSILIMGIILFGIVSLGILNTLFMSLYERMFEFGVLRAVGTRPFAIAQLILYEAGSLSAISIAVGSLIGFVVLTIISHTGIDYTGIEFAGVTFRRLLYPIITIGQFIRYPLWVFVFTLVCAIYPALYAARMSAIEAMRKSF